MSRAPTSRASTPRTSVRDRISKRTMLLRRLKKWVGPAAWTSFVLLVVGAGLFAVRGVAPGSTIAGMRERLGGSTGFAGLRVADVKVDGQANTPLPLLYAAIGVAKGDPILGFSVEAARARVESLTWVEQATVERRLPDIVVVSIKERRPFAIWQNQKKYVLIDRAGQVVANQDVALFKDKLPMVVGPGAPIAANALVKALEKYPSLSGRILAAVRVGERRWDLHLKNGIDVMLPEGHEPEALERLLQLHQDHALMDRPLVAIDLRLPDRLVVRPRPDSGTTQAGPTQTGVAGPSTVPPPPPSPPAAI
ncbi:MAG: cell division protein FtsQ/DivIB, partial [Rhodospirillales bacterium]